MADRKKRVVHRRRIQPIWLITAAVALLLVWAVVQYRQDMAAPPATQPPTEAVAAVGDTITIAAAGDINISQPLMDQALQSDGSYDFSSQFVGVASLLSNADLTVVDLETNFCGAPYDAQQNNAPESLLSALAQAGVDLVQTANTASIYNGVAGLESTLAAVEAAGLTPVGTFASSRQGEPKYTIVQTQGFRVAFVAFTKGVGNLRLPQGAEDCVNLLYTDYSTTYQQVDEEGIRQVLDAVAAEEPDITIALLHWGSEYDREISQTQRQIQSIMLEGGVDVILGAHSHLVGEVETGQDGLTAFSLGNLLSVDSQSGTNQGVVLRLEFTMEEEGAKLTSWQYDPVYLSGTTLVNTNDAIALYESGYVDRVSQELYELLCRSRDQIAELIQPEPEA